MRKIIVQEMITVDGFFAGPNGEIDWHHVDSEFNEYAIEFLNTVDTLMFGRITYDLMESYWPTSAALQDDPIVAEKMNNLSKIFSEINTEEIRKMKQVPGKDIAIFGSGIIVTTLTELGLIDEYRFIVNPVILGKGKTLFSNLEKKPGLQLLKTQEFKSGNVLLYYRPS